MAASSVLACSLCITSPNTTCVRPSPRLPPLFMPRRQVAFQVRIAPGIHYQQDVTLITRVICQSFSRRERDDYVEGKREQVPFGVPCFKIQQYILGYTTAYKYIDTLYTNWRLQKIETGEKKKKNGRIVKGNGGMEAHWNQRKIG